MNDAQAIHLRDVPKGEYLKRKIDAKTIYIRGDYCRDAKCFEIIDADDINKVMYVKADKIVFIGFTY